MLEPQYRYLTCDDNKGVLVVTVMRTMVLDRAVADQLRQDLLGALEFHKPQRLIVDLSNVNAISSAGLRPVITLQRRVQELKGRLVLCGLHEMVAEVFRLTGLINTEPGQESPLETAPDIAAAHACICRN
jgi:anti-anti-sigma factor